MRNPVFILLLVTIILIAMGASSSSIARGEEPNISAEQKEVRESENDALLKLGIRIGTGYIMNTTPGDDQENFARLLLGAFYQGTYLDAEISGITYSRAELISSLLNIRPLPFIGIGGAYLFVRDELAVNKKDTVGEKYSRGEYHAALLGIIIIPATCLRISLYLGRAVTGTITHQDEMNTWHRYEIKNKHSYSPSALIGMIEYRYNDLISVMISYYENGGEGSSDESLAPEEKQDMETRFITLSIGYSLSF
jgi:hypothetical protein